MEAPSGPERCSSPDWEVCAYVNVNQRKQCIHVLKSSCIFCEADGAWCIHDTPECLQSCLFVMRVFLGRRLRQVGRHSTSLSKQNYSTIPCSQRSPHHFGVFHHWRSLRAWRQNYYNPAAHLWSTADKFTLASQTLVCIHVAAWDNEVFWNSNCKMV